MIRVRFHRAASAEAAVRWYNERVPGLGDDFSAELIAAVEWIVEGPEVWPISVDDPRARRYLLSRFPLGSGPAQRLPRSRQLSRSGVELKPFSYPPGQWTQTSPSQSA